VRHGIDCGFLVVAELVEHPGHAPSRAEGTRLLSAGERLALAPRSKKATEYLAGQSFWRAPYMCSFRAGNFDFILIATHTRWGDSIEGREHELQLLADWIETRFKSKFVEDHDLVVMGDFNVPKIGDKLFQALTSHDLKVPKQLLKLTAGDQVLGGTNLGKDARYDQILHSPTVPENSCIAGGTLDFFIDDKHIDDLFPSKKLTREKFSPTLRPHAALDSNHDGYRWHATGANHSGQQEIS